MKSILLDAHEDQFLPARVRAAQALARMFHARLTGLQTVQPPALLATTLLGAELREAEFETRIAPAIVAADRSRDQIVKQLRGRRPMHWERDVGDRGTRLMLHARLADIAVVSIEDLRDFGGLPDEMARRAPCPLLALPTSTASFDPAAPVLVAWDGSQSSASALRHAVPLLRHSEDVRLVTIGQEPELKLGHALNYLMQHGVSASGDLLVESAPIASILIGAAAEHCAGLIVLGAAGHNSLGRVFFGSVANALINRDAVPLFLAH